MKEIFPQVPLGPTRISKYNAYVDMYLIAFVFRYVATAMSVACQVNWASNFVVSIGWPLMHHAMGSYSFVTFDTILLATFLFTLFYLPETSGRSAAEVQNAANEPRRGYGNRCGGIAEEASQGLWDNPGPITSGSASSDVAINEVDWHSVV